MSREFGSYMSGYFHSQIEQGADDCLAGRDELTKLWGAFLKEFSDIAWSIASSEAGDSGPDDTILTTLEKMPELYSRMNEIEKYLAPFKQVIAQTVRQQLNNSRGE